MQAPPVELRRTDIEEPAHDQAPPIRPDFSNALPFARRGTRYVEPDTSQEIIKPSERLVPTAPRGRGRTRLLILLAISFAIHAALIMLLWRPPPPLPGIELAPITVDIVVNDAA